MVACCRGFVDIVPLLRHCPYVDVNQQDTEGNTALMMAAQAGHITIVNYLLNYFPALDVERRDARGLTALMKAAVQGQQDCVTALLLAGADLHAVDPIKGKTAKEWAAFTGRFETTVRIRTLLRRPRAEQFGTHYLPEWPALAGLVAKALSPKSRSQRLSEKIRSLFTFRIPRDPEEDGVLDHMVRMTTSLASPFVSTACQTVCPDSPPEVGKRRLSVAEILQEPGTGTAACNGQLVGHGQLEGHGQLVGHGQQVGNGQVALDRAVVEMASRRHRLLGFLPRLLRANCIFPGERVPRIKLSKASSPPACGRERRPRARDKALLQPPKWRYKELKEEKRAAEEAEGEKK
ncbi:ankyrin repeat domain-containing protein 33B, partial [Meleagris gallopavo]